MFGHHRQIRHCADCILLMNELLSHKLVQIFTTLTFIKSLHSVYVSMTSNHIHKWKDLTKTIKIIIKLFPQVCSRCRVMTFKQSLSGRKPPSCLLSVWLEVTQQFPVQDESTAEMKEQITAGNISVSRSWAATTDCGRSDFPQTVKWRLFNCCGKEAPRFHLHLISGQITSVTKKTKQMQIWN